MNRAPGKGDTWWANHQAECGGTYTKTQEPPPTKKQLDAMSTKERAGRQKNKLDSWIQPKGRVASAKEGGISSKPIDLENEIDSSLRASKQGNGKTNVEAESTKSAEQASTSSAHSQKRPLADIETGNGQPEKKIMVECPICSTKIAETNINEHLDVMHS